MQDDAETGTVGTVGATAVPQAAEIEEDGAGGHFGRNGRGVGARSLVVPAVTAHHDAGGPVLLGEVLERPHDVHHELGVGPGERVQGVVGVQRLRHLAGADLDGRGRAELVVAEDAVEDAEHEGVGCGPVERTRLCEQGVHPAGATALEVVAPEGSRLEDARKLGAGPVELVGAEHVLDDGVAVDAEGGDHVGGSVIGDDDHPPNSCTPNASMSRSFHGSRGRPRGNWAGGAPGRVASGSDPPR